MIASAVRDYALWDTLPDVRFRCEFFTAPTPTAARKRRATERTADFAAAAAGLEPATSLAHDLARRRDRWQEQLEEPDSNQESSRRGLHRGILEALTCGADEVIVLVLLVSALALVVSTIMGLILAVPWLVWHISRVQRRRRCRLALEHTRCPDCGYDLKGAPEPIDRAILGGLSAGPDRCPECGVPWPLVPPPTRGR